MDLCPGTASKHTGEILALPCGFYCPFLPPSIQLLPDFVHSILGSGGRLIFGIFSHNGQGHNIGGKRWTSIRCHKLLQPGVGCSSFFQNRLARGRLGRFALRPAARQYREGCHEVCKGQGLKICHQKTARLKCQPWQNIDIPFAPQWQPVPKQCLRHCSRR